MVLVVYGFYHQQLYAQETTNIKADTLKEVVVKDFNNSIELSPKQEIAAKDFIKTGAYNLVDAIKNFSGINIKDYGGIGGLKTVSVRSLGSNHTGLLYDGLPITDAQNGQIDFGKLQLDNIESIDLYNSQPQDLPQAAIAYASASVISIKTIRPNFNIKPYQLTTKFNFGSFALINPVLLWQQKISKNWAYSFNTSWQKADGVYKYQLKGDGTDSVRRRKNSDIDALQFDAGIFGNFSKNSSLLIRANYYDSERGLPGATIFNNTSSSQRLWNKDKYIFASFKQNFNSHLKLQVNSKIAENYIHYIDPEYLNANNKLDQRYTQREYYQSIAANYLLNKFINVNYAIDATVNTLKTNLYNYAYPTRLTLLQNFGTQINYRKWKIAANILNTQVNEWVNEGESSPNRSVFSPAFHVSYQPFTDRNLAFNAFYKSIFRYPTFNDLYYTNFGNRNLNPEDVKQYNLGFKYQKKEKGKFTDISFSTDAYYNKVSNKIIATPNKDLFLWTVRNIGKVDIYGVETAFNFNYKWNGKWFSSFVANYTYQLAKDVSNPESTIYNNQIPYTPKHSFNINTGFFDKNIGFYYNQTFSSGRYYLSENKPDDFVPGFYIADLSVDKKINIYKQAFQVQLSVNNLFNSSYSFIRSFPMPGTSFRISLKTTI